MKMTDAISAEVLVTQVLLEAGVPSADMTLDDDDLPFCDRSGYFISDTRGPRVEIAIIGASNLWEAVRQAERDGLTQQVRAALDSAGWAVSVNEYGHLSAKMPSDD